MNRNRLQLCLGGFAILMAIMACVLPGRTAAPSVPTIDPNTMATSIAGTAQASAQQTEQASIPTLVPATSTPLVSPITGTSLGKLEDQSTLFIDSKAGVQVTIPPGWLAVRLNEDEYYKAFSLDVVLTNPLINERLTRIASLNSSYFRVEAIDIRPEHLSGGFISVMDVVFQSGDLRTLEKWAEAERNKKSPLQGHKFLSSKFQETADGTRVLVIEESWPNGDDTIYYRGVFFSLSTGTIVLDFFTSLDFKDTVIPEFEQVVNSLTVITP